MSNTYGNKKTESPVQKRCQRARALCHPRSLSALSVAAPLIHFRVLTFCHLFQRVTCCNGVFFLIIRLGPADLPPRPWCCGSRVLVAGTREARKQPSIVSVAVYVASSRHHRVWPFWP